MNPYLRFVQRRHIAFALFVVLLLTVTEANGVSIEYSCIRLISQDGIRQNWLANITTGQVSKTDLPNIIYQPYAISPDGHYAIYRNPQPESAPHTQDHYQLVVQSWFGKPVVLQQDIPDNSGANVWFQWSPDSQRFIYTAISGYIPDSSAKINVTIAEPDGKETPISSYDPSWASLGSNSPFLEVELLGWSSDGEYVAFLHPNGKEKSTDLEIWSVSEKHLVSYKLPPQDDPYDMHFIGQVWIGHKIGFVLRGSLVVASADNENIQTYTLPSSDQPDNTIRHLIWSPDGRFLAVLSLNLDILDVQHQKFVESVHQGLTSHVGAPQYCGDCVYPDYDIEPVTWSNDSKTVYMFQGPPDYDKSANLVALNVSTGKFETLITNIKDARWLLPARLLAHTVKNTNGDKLYWFDVQTHTDHSIDNLPAEALWNVVLSPNRQYMLLTFEEIIDPKQNTFKDVVELLPLTGPWIKKLATVSSYADTRSFVWSPNSANVAI